MIPRVMKVWFCGEDASVAMGLGDYYRPSGPHRTYEEAAKAARYWEGEGRVCIYEATLVADIDIRVTRDVKERPV